MTRRRITNLMRARVFLNHAGRCHICGLRIDVIKQKYDIDHIKALWNGGPDEEDNMAPVHVGCHGNKTAEEAPIRAKSNRVRAAYLGIKRPKQKIRGWRRFNGDPVFADDR